MLQGIVVMREWEDVSKSPLTKGHKIWSASRWVIKIIKFLNILPLFAQ